VLAVVCTSFGSILVRLADAPALAVSFYRVALASLVLLPFAADKARTSWPTLTGRQRLLLVGAGVALASHFATWIASLSLTSIAASTLLVNTAPVFAVLLAWLFLREPPTQVLLVAIPVALFGAALIAVGDRDASPGSLAGNLLALAGAVSLAV
jgi:drug/metabolite transporter (DMT)-like permease